VRRQLVCTESCKLLTVLHQVDQLDPVSITDPEATKSGAREETLVQRNSHRLESGSSAVAGLTETASRKRKHLSEPPNLNVGSDLPSQAPQPTMEDRASAQSFQVSKPSKRLIMDCLDHHVTTETAQETRSSRNIWRRGPFASNGHDTR